jgi:transcription factor E
MQIKFLKSIVENLTNKQSAEIVDLLADKKDVNEFIIANKLGLTINQTRNILYKLSDFGLVSFIRKKDKRKGWYIYFWTLNASRSLGLLGERLNEELNRLRTELINRKEKRFYICKSCSLEVNEETALLNDFVCTDCEQVYELSDNSEIIQQLEKEIFRLEKEIEIISEEQKIENEKLNKVRVRKIKRADKIKKDVRTKKALERKAIREKEKKMAEKLKPKSIKSKSSIKKTKKDIKKNKIKKNSKKFSKK